MTDPNSAAAGAVPLTETGDGGRCFWCMAELPEGAEACPLCSFRQADWTKTQPPYALGRGAALHAGKYLLGRVLGQGGFGITYLAWDRELHCPVAVKEYFPMQTATRSLPDTALNWHIDPEERDKGRVRFIHEARKLAKVSRIPSVVHVQDVFFQNVTAYIVMDFIAGETLAAHMGVGRKKKPVTFPVRACYQLLKPVMEALAQAHSLGLIHRDVSPDNIMVDVSGNPWLLDLGAAKDMDPGSGAYSHSTNLMVRSGFSPLEQYTSAGLIGAWTDVYAMCATMYACLTGRELPPSVDRLKNEELNLSSELPLPIAGVLERGLVLRPLSRIQNMQELEAALEEAIDVLPPEKPAWQRWLLRHKTQAVCVLLAAAMAGAAGYGVYRWRMTLNPPAVTETLEATELPTPVQETRTPATAEAWAPVDPAIDFVEEEDGTVTVTAYRGGHAAVRLPDTIYGKPVAAIGDQAFYHMSAITSVELPDTVRSIGKNAFEGCEGLTELKLPAELETIGDGAFLRCSALKELTLPAGLEVIGAESFSGCSALIELTLPSHLREMGEGAFSWCAKLRGIRVEEGNAVFASVDGVVFSADGSVLLCYPAGKTVWDAVTRPGSDENPLEYRYDIPEGALEVADGAFSGAWMLQTVTIPEGMTRIGSRCFYGCGLTSMHLPDSVTELGQEAFRECRELTEARLSENLDSVASLSFFACGLRHIFIPDSVRIVKALAFYACDSLETASVAADTRYFQTHGGEEYVDASFPEHTEILVRT